MLAPDFILSSIWIGFSIFGVYALIGVIAGGLSQASTEKVDSINANSAPVKKLSSIHIEKNQEKEDTALLDLPLPHLPLDTFKVTSFFGPRGKALHKGVDFDGEMGDPVYAVWKGTVFFAGEKKGYGKIIELQHANGIRTYYAHLKTIRFKKGNTITRGAVIGSVGNSGKSIGKKDGSHLHFEIRRNQKAVDPLPYLKTTKEK